MLSYQHIYHAGNGADLQKHLWLLTVFEYLLKKDKPFCWIDTHAGRGLYDLGSAEAQKLSEYKTALKVYDVLKEQNDLPSSLALYMRLLGEHAPQNYPGSALLTAKMLRAGDRMLAYDMHRGEYPHLAITLTPYLNTKTRQADGMAALLANSPPTERRGGALIDPSYEIKTDYADVVGTVATALKKWSTGVFMIWYPLLAAGHHKALVEDCKALASDVVIDEWIWRDPNAEGKGLYGTGMAVFNAPFTTAQTMSDVRDIVLPLIKA